MTISERGILSRIESTLPSRYYYAQDIYDLEKERIFYSMWVYAGRANEIPKPGDFMVRKIGDESIVITRDKQGELHAFYNVCRHRGTRLCSVQEGKFKGSAIVCPYHGWTYGLDGELLAMPNMLDADNFDQKDYPLFSAGLEVWEGLVFVNLAEEREPLSSQLGDYWTRFQRYHIGELKLGKQITYDLKANWKIIVENYSECLHCPQIHPELCDIVPIYQRGILHEPDGEYGNRIIEGGYTFAPNGKSNRPLFPDLNEEERNTYRGGTIFPNLLVNLHPDCVTNHILWPEGPDRTRVVCEWLFEPSTMERSDFDPSDIVEFWDRVNVQDWEVCELEQLGTQSRAYQHGVYAPQEGFLYSFNQFVLQKLGHQQGANLG
ncbi:MAG: aromatic ring-hydroxylating dioxygenase subunit alpha [Dehalococcoidia bacterium]